MAFGAIVGGLGLGYSIYKDRQADIQSRKAARAQKRLNAAQEARKRRAQIREAQTAAGALELRGAANGGAGTSSNVVSGQASLSSQLATNLNFLSNTSADSQKATDALAQAARLRSQGALGQAIGNFAMNNSDRIDNLFE